MKQTALQIERLFLTVVLAVVALPVCGADCNGNGIEDALDLEPESVRFEPFPDLDLAFRPTAVAISDLNRDGKPDLATVSRDTGVGSVLLNREGGSFLAPRNFPVAAAPAALAAADLDGDGAAEVAIAAPFRLDLFRNGGAGEMAFAESFPHGANPVSVLFADLDGDADLDLATANSLPGAELPGNVSVFPNRGASRFSPARNFGVGKDPRSIVAADLD